VKTYGVEVKLNTPGTVEEIKNSGAEAVFMACGGKAIRPLLEGIEKAVTAEDVLAGKAEVKGENVVVVGGGVTGLETAETLAKNYKVTVVEMLDKVGGNLYPSITMHLAQEIMKAGGAIAKGKALMSVNEGSVTVKDTHTSEEAEIPADTVVLAMGVASVRPEIEEFRKEFGDRLILVGDSDRPGQIYDALHSGHDRAFVYDR
jgi:pyruvate/2-oxoglutarate dehydrogenase complex dihydrolipoamide dehydrogenase (E3) component